MSEITRNDRHRVKCLFLLGAGDDVLPTVERRGGVLDDEDRETLQQHDIELSNATFDALDNELPEHLRGAHPADGVSPCELARG